MKGMRLRPASAPFASSPANQAEDKLPRTVGWLMPIDPASPSSRPRTAPSAQTPSRLPFGGSPSGGASVASGGSRRSGRSARSGSARSRSPPAKRELGVRREDQPGRKREVMHGWRPRTKPKPLDDDQAPLDHTLARWIKSYNSEQTVFASDFLSAEVKLREAATTTETLRLGGEYVPPRNLAIVTCDVLLSIAKQFGRFEGLMNLVARNVMRCVFPPRTDPSALADGASGDGAVDEPPAKGTDLVYMVPWYEMWRTAVQEQRREARGAQRGLRRALLETNKELEAQREVLGQELTLEKEKVEKAAKSSRKKHVDKVVGRARVSFANRERAAPAPGDSAAQLERKKTMGLNLNLAGAVDGAPRRPSIVRATAIRHRFLQASRDAQTELPGGGPLAAWERRGDERKGRRERDRRRDAAAKKFGGSITAKHRPFGSGHSGPAARRTHQIKDRAELDVDQCLELASDALVEKVRQDAEDRVLHQPFQHLRPYFMDYLLRRYGVRALATKFRRAVEKCVEQTPPDELHPRLRVFALLYGLKLKEEEAGEAFAASTADLRGSAASPPRGSSPAKADGAGEAKKPKPKKRKNKDRGGGRRPFNQNVDDREGVVQFFTELILSCVGTSEDFKELLDDAFEESRSSASRTSSRASASPSGRPTLSPGRMPPKNDGLAAKAAMRFESAVPLDAVLERLVRCWPLEKRAPTGRQALETALRPALRLMRRTVVAWRATRESQTKLARRAFRRADALIHADEYSPRGVFSYAEFEELVQDHCKLADVDRQDATFLFKRWHELCDIRGTAARLPRDERTEEAFLNDIRDPTARRAALEEMRRVGDNRSAEATEDYFDEKDDGERALEAMRFELDEDVDENESLGDSVEVAARMCEANLADVEIASRAFADTLWMARLRLGADLAPEKDGDADSFASTVSRANRSPSPPRPSRAGRLKYLKWGFAEPPPGMAAAPPAETARRQREIAAKEREACCRASTGRCLLETPTFHMFGTVHEDEDPAELPLVSVVVPTYPKRHAYHALTLAYGPRYLEVLLPHLRHCGGDMVSLNGWYNYLTWCDRIERVRPSGKMTRGESFLHSRRMKTTGALFEFPRIELGEDVAAEAAAVHAVDDDVGLFFHVEHGIKSSPRVVGDEVRGAAPRPAADLLAMLDVHRPLLRTL
ncbi:hypothetical protein JL721_11014 [Aureococcus anophagefferens]|nr:hypothetical protein JL721_11014 [Aureococcus anophagefferens]